jgi:hypothetical protein
LGHPHFAIMEQAFMAVWVAVLSCWVCTALLLG